MTNGELFIKENPNVEIKINGSCVWIYFDNVNHYTMSVEWWNKEIGLLDKIKAEILLRDTNVKAVRTDGCCFFTAEEIFEIIDKHIAEGSEKNE